MMPLLNENAARDLALSDEDARFHLALGLFVDGRASLGRATAIAGMGRIEFQKALAERKVPLGYERKDLEADLSTLAGLTPR